MRNKLLWLLQLIINEAFMLKAFSYIESMYYKVKVENGWSIILSMILVIVFLLGGYIFTNILRRSK